ncbi:MAG: PAS domain S-box protein, partial [Candidatus Promineifilaceae bacterium]
MIKQKTERHFRAIIEKSRDAVLLVDANLKITYANPSATRMLGYGSEMVRGMNILDLVHPTDNILIEKYRLQLNNDDAFPVEIRLQHQDGSWLWLEFTTTNLLDDPDLESILLTFRNITDRKEAQYALQSQRDLLLNLLAVSQATNEAAELDKMLHNLVKIGKWITLANSGTVFLFDHLGKPVHANSYHGQLDPDRVQRLMNEGLCKWVMQNNQPTLVTDTITDKRWLELPPLGPLPRSALAVPIQGKEGIQA